MRVYNYLRSLFLFVTAALLIVTVTFTPDLAGADAIGQMRSLLGAEGVVSEALEEGAGDPESGEGDTTVGCGPEAVLPVEVCELGQGLLCLNSPPFSVDDDYVVVKGTVDRRTSVFSHLRVYVQHEYTKDFNEIEIDDWAEDDCWEEGSLSNQKACLDRLGYFAIEVPVSEPGPYTIMIDAVSLDGDATSKAVRTSRVVAPVIKQEDIVIDPDPAAGSGPIEASKVGLTVDLLHGCRDCDFIGTSTGGLMLRVTNLITTPDGGTKTITRRGNVAAGGVFDVCVPVLSGKNNLTVEACNAATGEDCPSVTGFSFDVISSDITIDIIEPDGSRLIYNAEDVSRIPLKFSIDGRLNDGGGCKEGDVTVRWNRGGEVSLCPEADGFYYASLIPETGTNVGTIRVRNSDIEMKRSFAVSYGRLVNPYKGPDAGWIDGGFGVHIGADYFNDTIRPVVNEFLNSDSVKKLVEGFFVPPGEGDLRDEEERRQKKVKTDAIREEIPHCSAAEDSGVIMKLVSEPVLEWGELERLSFDSSGVGFKLNLKGLEIRIQAFRDDNKDGRPDETVIPLLLSFDGLTVDGRLRFRPDDLPLVLLTSDHTDCDFISGSFCKGKPALITLANIVGGATEGGSFVRCDDEGQQISGEMEEVCEDINKTNAITGALNLKVLNTLNDLLYCGGSAHLTYLMRYVVREITRSVTLPSERTVWLSGGLDPLAGRVDTNANGFTAMIPARFGGGGVISHMDGRAAGPGTGVLTDLVTSVSGMGGVGPASMGISLAIPWINELLYQLAFQVEGFGLLDWEIDSLFFEALGFDFISECDAFEPTPEIQKPPVLCQLRPRVGEMLGTALTTNGYFGAKDPLRMKLVGSRAVAPHLKIYRDNVPYELPPLPGEEEIRYEYRPADVVEIQIPDLELAFYALEIDEEAGKDDFGNPYLLFGVDGRPVIHSMIEGSAAPVPIIVVKATLIFALEVGEIATSAEDPSQLELRVRPIPEFTRVVFRRIPGGNATIVPDESILSAFREKLNYGIEIYGDSDNAIRLKIPKTISLNFFSSLGLNELILGRDGLSIELGARHLWITLSTGAWHH